MTTSHPAWKASLHGGHSGEFCDHAEGTLRQVLEAAVQYGYATFGVSEHAPRVCDKHLYAEERALGWGTHKLAALFDNYTARVHELADEFADRLTVLCGFEAEVVPEESYGELMNGYRDDGQFDYLVGSVHWIDDLGLDGDIESFDQLLARCGDNEAVSIRYYEKVAEMAEVLKPEVVAHLDLVRCHAPSDASVDTPAIRTAAEEALESIREAGSILDVNTAGIRKGLGHPYPAPWLLRRAQVLNIPFCFGDDSHGPNQVGMDVEAARAYLLENDVHWITTLVRNGDGLAKKKIALNL